jgi:hypothetical protein
MIRVVTTCAASPAFRLGHENTVDKVVREIALFAQPPDFPGEAQRSF